MESGQNNDAGQIERRREFLKNVFIGLLAFIVVLALFRLFWK